MTLTNQDGWLCARTWMSFFMRILNVHLQFLYEFDMIQSWKQAKLPREKIYNNYSMSHTKTLAVWVEKL